MEIEYYVRHLYKRYCVKDFGFRVILLGACIYSTDLVEIL